MVQPHAAALQRHADFRERVEPYFPSMFALARSIVKSDDLAWDAVQDALLRVWQLKILPDNPRGVLMRFVFPKSLELLRAQRRRTRYERGTCELSPEASAVEDPAFVAERDEETAHVQRHVSRLPQECREVISLRRDWGLDYAEIANKLNVPVGTVRSRLHRARLLLRARMNPVFRTTQSLH
jgi:RNA polymerase sigma-70 factor (ECF subfamily)